VIRIVLLGRTGNNLFQYALGRVLAEKHGVSLSLDASWFNPQGWAEVSHFLKLSLNAKVVRRASIAARGLRKFTGKHYWEYSGVPVLREPTDDQSYSSRFAEAPADCMLFGYFQSPRYFEGISASLRSELNGLLRSVQIPDNGRVHHPASIRDEIVSPSSVAVHVRRGDYLNHPSFQVCDPSYYQKSMDQLRARLPSARFFIFSDDLEWCRARFQAPDQTIVDSGDSGANPLCDLYLMSLASHHIIANSSYSWWAAWLGEKPNQQVMMPNRWYVNGIKAPVEEKMMGHWTIVR
jgi:hypothetical protein